MHRYRNMALEHGPQGRLAAGAGLILLLCGPVAAQQQEIVSSKIEVSTGAASLRLELAGGGTLALDFAQGIATLNGDPLGSYVPGGASDRAWRGLLDEVYSLSGTTLARELDGWRPESGLAEADLALLGRIEDAFDQVLTVAGQAPSTAAGQPAAAGGTQLAGRSPDFLRALAAAIEGVEIAEGELHIGEDHTITEGARVDGNVLLADGHLDVRGHVRGSVTVVEGSLTLSATGLIDGDVRLMNATLHNNGGMVGGQWVDLREELDRREARQNDLIRAELREELSGRTSRTAPRQSMFLFRLRQATGLVLGLTVAYLVLGFLTFLLTVFSGRRVRSVVGEIQQNLRGSTLAGLAGLYAVLPVFILVSAALTVTVVGIPALLVWLPLFPLAVALAGLAGFVGVAENVGRWALRYDLKWLRWVDDSNTYFVRLAGIGIFMVPLLVGSLLAYIPYVDWVGQAIGVIGLIGWGAALIVGFGAVIITRGGSRGEHWARGLADDGLDTGGWPDERDLSTADDAAPAESEAEGGDAR